MLDYSGFLTGGGIEENGDYTSDTPVQVLFPGGTTRATFKVQMTDNVVLEDEESFIVSINPDSLPYGVALGQNRSAEFVIEDDDGMYNYSLLSEYIIKTNSNVHLVVYKKWEANQKQYSNCTCNKNA